MMARVDERSKTPKVVAPLEDAVGDSPDCDSRGVMSMTRSVVRDLSRIDHAVYEAIASTPTPFLDVPIRRLSNSANYSLLWVGAAGVLATIGGPRGRRSAAAGLTSIVVSSAAVNLILKNLHGRDRPNRAGAGSDSLRHTRMPDSSSFPSGHSASGFAFATAVGHQIPSLSFPLRVLAASVAYSRVHSGVHFPGDAIVGSLAGGAIGLMVGAQFDKSFPRSIGST
jgi:membrane-associated phospholipid phosphatase